VELEGSFPAQPNAPMLARRQVGRFLRSTVSPERLDDVRLAVSELVTNAVINGRISGEDTIGMTVHVDEELEVVRVMVEQPQRRHPSRVRGSEEPALFVSALLLEEVTDRWGTVVGPPPRAWFEIDLDRPST
jgi:anti-sigma regulatory factor (Ser/Thr protein kinase)